MLYMSLLSVVKYLQGDFFFLSLLWQKAERRETGIFFWCWDVRGKAVTSPVIDETVNLVLRGAEIPTPRRSRVLCAVFLSQLYRVMSRCGDAWRINYISLLCIIHPEVGVKFLFSVWEEIGIMNFSSGGFAPEQTLSFGGWEELDLIRMHSTTAHWWSWFLSQVHLAKQNLACLSW